MLKSGCRDLSIVKEMWVRCADGSRLGLSAPRNVVSSHSVLPDLGANDVLGSQRQDGLCTIEVGYHRVTIKKGPSKRAESAASIVR